MLTKSGHGVLGVTLCTLALLSLVQARAAPVVDGHQPDSGSSNKQGKTETGRVLRGPDKSVRSIQKGLKKHSSSNQASLSHNSGHGTSLAKESSKVSKQRILRFPEADLDGDNVADNLDVRHSHDDDDFTFMEDTLTTETDLKSDVGADEMEQKFDLGADESFDDFETDSNEGIDSSELLVGTDENTDSNEILLDAQMELSDDSKKPVELVLRRKEKSTLTNLEAAAESLSAGAETVMIALITGGSLVGGIIIISVIVLIGIKKSAKIRRAMRGLVKGADASNRGPHPDLDPDHSDRSTSGSGSDSNGQRRVPTITKLG